MLVRAESVEELGELGPQPVLVREQVSVDVEVVGTNLDQLFHVRGM
jgi:hypothetical protein